MSTPFYDLASLVVVPSGYKASKVYAQKPLTTDGQLTFSRASTATRVNSAGLIEEVASNVPRLDYLNSSCPRLLLEPQRTNSITYSEQFNNATWELAGSSVTANSAVSPDGFTNADLLTADGANSIHDIYESFNGSTTNSVSIFVKKGTARYVNVVTNYVGTGTDWVSVVFDLDTLTSNVDQSGGITSSSVKIDNYGNGWYRLISNTNAASATTLYAFFGISDTLNPTRGSRGRVSHTSSATLNLYGAQAEEGAYATSYIPTLGAAVTRLADAASKTGISSLIGQTEGTLFLELDIVAGSPVYHTLMQVYGDIDNRVAIGQDIDSTNVFLYINASGSASYQTTTTPAGHYKIALAYKNGDVAMYINGVPAITSTRSVSFGTALTTFFLNNVNGNEIGIFKDSQALLFKTRLTNAQLAELTTL